MEYIYAAMLLHKAGKNVDEASVKKVLEAAGIAPDDARTKALIAALEGVNIEEAIKKAAVVPVAVAAPSAGQGAGEDKKKAPEKKEEKKEEKNEEQAAAGLGALFG
ncbi:50S ribosomal protein P1 [Candidatus Woesearchaeota archaeon CG_4_10_14_0_8_um_filter_47_5]|nr:MAG: 50S ribosomal protein P1 [Candidatus Woesearchaeota archaeon CG_4_10_14_0_8_um_filter_47_5]